MKWESAQKVDSGEENFLQLGIKPVTFQSKVQCSNTELPHSLSQGKHIWVKKMMKFPTLQNKSGYERLSSADDINWTKLDKQTDNTDRQT